MAQLTDEEKAVLQRLQDKAKAPDAPPVGRSFSFELKDLKDPELVGKAKRLGLFPDDFDVEAPPSDDGGESGADEAPKRRGYFPSDK